MYRYLTEIDTIMRDSRMILTESPMETLIRLLKLADRPGTAAEGANARQKAETIAKKNGISLDSVRREMNKPAYKPSGGGERYDPEKHSMKPVWLDIDREMRAEGWSESKRTPAGADDYGKHDREYTNAHFPHMVVTIGWHDPLYRTSPLPTWTAEIDGEPFIDGGTANLHRCMVSMPRYRKEWDAIQTEKKLASKAGFVAELFDLPGEHHRHVFFHKKNHNIILQIYKVNTEQYAEDGGRWALFDKNGSVHHGLFVSGKDPDSLKKALKQNPL